ncbi:MAG: carbohydrate-binding protein [Paludibacter sp.]|jgi:predicted alpha-1,6-mannanase (GH76 family)|nr:carbohydrate-binding protein [Paludibacter sp.]
MKHTILTLLSTFCILHFTFSQIPDGVALKINSCYGSGKAISLPNSSLDEDAAVIAWTETAVPAQRWRASAAGNGLFFLQNCYSELFLSNQSAQRPNLEHRQSQKTNDSNSTKWEFVPVANASFPNAYYIRYYVKRNGSATGDDLFLEITSDADGAYTQLYSKRSDADSLRQMWTVVAEDILPNRVTPSFRDSVMRGWKDRYFNWLKNETTGFWGEAEMLETILDGYETSGKQEYKTMFEDAYEHFVGGNSSGSNWWNEKGNGKDWRWNDYNDDIAWAVLASVRAYLMFGQHPNASINYLTIAKQNYDWMYSRALLSSSGMLRWSQSPYGNRGSNSCINGPAEIAACYLAIATGDDTYYEKAKNLYAKQRQYLYEPSTGKVYDSGSWNSGYTVFTVGNTWVSTYNQGTFLGAALMLYNRYGDAQYKTDADKIVEWTRNDLCNTRGIVRVCGSGDDLQGFKGILMRYLRRYVVDLALPEKVEWLQANALHAYNNRNSKGIIWTAWWEKSAENFKFAPDNNYDFYNKPFGSSTALSAAFNAPLDKNLIIKNAFEIIEAENFDYVKGIFVERTNDSVAIVSNTNNDYFTAYNNVDFGGETAVEVEFLVQNSSRNTRQIEIHLDSPNGTLLGTASIPSSNGWITAACAIPNTTGRHNIYLVYKGSDIKVDNFRFKTQTDAVENPKSTSQLKFYPNPANDKLIIDNEKLTIKEVQILDLTGKIIFNSLPITIGTTLNSIDVSFLQSGIYFVNLIATDGVMSGRFLKR